MILVFAILAAISFALTLWQWIEARSFPLHRRAATSDYAPAITILKPLKGRDRETEPCLRSWFEQAYHGEQQLLFGVASEDDPAVDVVRKLLKLYPKADAELLVCTEPLGVNAKVAKLAALERRAKHGVLVVSDADVWAPPDLVQNLVAPLREDETALVNPFYRQVTGGSVAVEWEKISVNADFWSSVLQARRLRSINFALGAVMAVKREALESIGGFRAIANHLADDYVLGNRLAASGHRIVISPVVVDCREPPNGWLVVWKHQLRWSRTIRVCQPGAYGLSLLSNATLWPLLWLAAAADGSALIGACFCLGVRMLTALDNRRRMEQSGQGLAWFWLPWVKDLLQFAVWLLSFLGKNVEWRGESYQVQRDGTLVRIARPG